MLREVKSKNITKMLQVLTVILLVSTCKTDADPKKQADDGKTFKICKVSKNSTCGPNNEDNSCPLKGYYCTEVGACNETDKATNAEISAASKLGYEAFNYRVECDEVENCNVSQAGTCGTTHDNMSCQNVGDICSDKGICGTGEAFKTNPQVLNNYRPYCDKNRTCNVAKPFEQCGEKNENKSCQLKGAFCSEYFNCGQVNEYRMNGHPEFNYREKCEIHTEAFAWYKQWWIYLVVISVIFLIIILFCFCSRREKKEDYVVAQTDVEKVKKGHWNEKWHPSDDEVDKPSDQFAQKQFDKTKTIGYTQLSEVSLIKKKEEYKKQSDKKYYTIKKVKLMDDDQKRLFQDTSFFMKYNSCPRIVRVHFVSLFKDQAFICRDFCRSTLEKFLDNEQNRANLELVKKLFLQCCEGIRYLHQNDQMHGNIKPENILVDNAHNAYLCDMSLSRELVGYVKPVAGGGTHYLSPEIINCKYEFSADIWALCASFYRIQKDLAPYHVKGAFNIIKTLNDKINCTDYEMITLTDINDAALIEVINNVLSKKAEERPSLDNVIESLTNSSDYKTNYDTKMNAIQQSNNKDILAIEPKNDTAAGSDKKLLQLKRTLVRGLRILINKVNSRLQVLCFMRVMSNLQRKPKADIIKNNFELNKI